MADALDHRSVVDCVGKHDHAGDLRTERAKRRPVGDVTGRKQKCGFLAVQIGQFALQQNVVVVGARDIPGASRTRATLIDGALHRLDHLGMLAHAEIVVGTPDGDVLPAAVSRIARRLRETAPLPLKIREHTIAAFLMKAVQFALEETLEIHACLQNLAILFDSKPPSVNPDGEKAGNLRQKAHSFELFQTIVTKSHADQPECGARPHEKGRMGPSFYSFPFGATFFYAAATARFAMTLIRLAR